MKLQEFSDELRKDPYFVIAELQLKLEEAAARIEELETENAARLTPASMQLPEPFTDVIIKFNDRYQIGFYDSEKCQWFAVGFSSCGRSETPNTYYAIFAENIEWKPL